MFLRNPIYRSLFEQAGEAAPGSAAAPGAAAAPAGAAPAAPAVAASSPAAAASAAAAPSVKSPDGQPSLLGGDGKPAAAAEPIKAAEEKPVEVPAADMRKYLTENTEDGKTDAGKQKLAAKTDAEVKTLYDTLKKEEEKNQFTLEAYAKNTKLPEGFNPSEDSFKAFFTLMGKHKVPQAEVQGFMDVYTKATIEAAQAPYRLWADTQTQWRNEVAKDREIGGAQLQANLALAAKFVDSLPNAEKVRAAMDYTGAGNHPEIVRALIFAGKMLAEGSLVQGRPTKGQPKSAAETFYPGGAAGVAAQS